MKRRNMSRQKRITWVIVVVSLILYSGQLLYTYTHPKASITILGYHHIVPDKDKETYYKHNMWVNSLSSFDAQMKLLKEEGYHSVTLDEVYEWKMGRKQLDEKSVVITFDDGFYSSIAFAKPVLETYGFEGSVFVIGSLIDEKRTTYVPQIRQHASSKDMKETTSTLKFYAHSYDLHEKNGDFKVNQLQKPALVEDVKKENKLVSTTYFAYPYGKYNPLIQEVLKENKTKLAFGYNENRKATLDDDSYALPRFNVNAYTRLDVFKQMLKSK